MVFNSRGLMVPSLLLLVKSPSSCQNLPDVLVKSCLGNGQHVWFGEESLPPGNQFLGTQWSQAMCKYYAEAGQSQVLCHLTVQISSLFRKQQRHRNDAKGDSHKLSKQKRILPANQSQHYNIFVASGWSLLHGAQVLLRCAAS